ncbi:unnamed protein product [Discosporangium mesarthrocarpum]
MAKAAREEWSRGRGRRGGWGLQEVHWQRKHSSEVGGGGEAKSSLEVMELTPEKHKLIRQSSLRRRGSSWFTQFRLLFKRSWRQATRDRFAAVARVITGFALGGVFGSIFWMMGLEESTIQNRVSLFVNIAINVSMFSCIRALQTLAVERPVIALERMDEGYSASSYFMAKVLAEIPVDMVFPIIFGSTVYFMAGLNKPIGGFTKLAKFLGILLLQGQASSALGLMVGCLSPSSEVANLLGPAIIVVFLMLGGVHSDIPAYLKKLEAFSTMKWGIQGIVTNEMRDLKFKPDGKKLLLGWKLGTNKEVIPGEDVMEKMGFAGQGLVQPTRRLFALSAAFHMVSLLNLFISVPRFQQLEGTSSSPQGGGLEGGPADQEPSLFTPLGEAVRGISVAGGVVGEVKREGAEGGIESPEVIRAGGGAGATSVEETGQHPSVKLAEQGESKGGLY